MFTCFDTEVLFLNTACRVWSKDVPVDTNACLSYTWCPLLESNIGPLNTICALCFEEWDVICFANNMFLLDCRIPLLECMTVRLERRMSHLERRTSLFENRMHLLENRIPLLRYTKMLTDTLQNVVWP